MKLFKELEPILRKEYKFIVDMSLNRIYYLHGSTVIMSDFGALDYELLNRIAAKRENNKLYFDQALTVLDIIPI